MQELYIDSVAHRYGSRLILSSVYMSCKIGEVIGLLGRNGCGKSTLLRIIFGTLKPDYSHIKVNGKLIRKGYITRQISYLPQDFFIPDHLKISYLVTLYTNKHKHELIKEPLIQEHLNMKIGDLSGGQKRLIECLLIMYSDSDFILLDEPFSQLAPVIVDEIKQHIHKLKAIKGFIITDHYYRQIIETSSSIVLLHNGCNYNINHIDDLKLYGYLPI
ncbi:ABC-type multidrug transport system, ATPase component [Pedobacter nyackensis]|uniref:ABC-type multidrug transport system, ATPase component n=2 Tax=Pedobacter nyackensis TaxID=475255 RepID=A0A1W2EHX4_9SPHI|nr:ABC-type multidrug transport system, ATPase component [Pedobacter nyackensis]